MTVEETLNGFACGTRIKLLYKENSWEGALFDWIEDGIPFSKKKAGHKHIENGKLIIEVEE